MFADYTDLLPETQNATATLCNWPVRDKSLVAPIATAVTGSLALIFVTIRVADCVAKKEFKLADLSAVLAFVSVSLVTYDPRMYQLIRKSDLFIAHGYI